MLGGGKTKRAAALIVLIDDGQYTAGRPDAVLLLPTGAMWLRCHRLTFLLLLLLLLLMMMMLRTMTIILMLLLAASSDGTKAKTKTTAGWILHRCLRSQQVQSSRGIRWCLTPEHQRIPRWLLHPGFRRCRSPSSAICSCPSTDCTKCSSQHVSCAICYLPQLTAA